MRDYTLAQLLGRSYSYAYYGWATNDNGNLFALANGWNNIRNTHCGGGPRGSFCNYDYDITGIKAGNPHNGYNNQYPDDKVFLEGSGGGDTLYRLKDGIERFFITDINNPAGSAQAQSSIPVMHDLFGGAQDAGGKAVARLQEFNHVPGGANVLYMDGHVEFLKYPSNYPLTRFAAIHSSSGEGDLAKPVVDANFFQFYTAR